MSLTPALEGTCPVNRNHADSLGLARVGRRDATSVEDLRWQHQYQTGSLDVASLARMSLAIVR
eukprot:6187156-Pleurochrysis_carterae.AAC.3